MIIRRRLIESMKQSRLNHVIEMIRKEKEPENTKEWINLLKAIRSKHLYVEMNENKIMVVSDKQNYHYYLLYLQKQKGNMQKIDFVTIEERARENDISLLICISKEESQCLLLEEPSGFFYFSKKIVDDENNTIIVI